MPRENVRGTVAQRDEGDGQLEAVRQQIRDARGWFEKVVPSHVNADQFIAIGLGVLSKNPDLANVAKRNPQSFMVALSECARLGLTPGDGYALTYFGSEIVGMVEYTGELELIYRTGRVRTIIAEIVWTEDTFSRGLHPHDPPTFAPAGGRFPKAAERGEPEGGFAYAVFQDGSCSRVVYMAEDEIMLHRKAAKTKQIWDGDFWRSMWLKTFVHELKKWVPTSPEYLREVMRVLAAGEPPAEQGMLPQPRQHAIGNGSPTAPHGGATGTDGGSGVPSGSSAGTGEPSPAEGGGKANPAVLSVIGKIMGEFGCTASNDRLGAVSILARRWIIRPTDVTAAEAEKIKVDLEGMRRTAGDGDLVAYWQGAIMNLREAWRSERPQDFPPEGEPQ